MAVKAEIKLKSLGCADSNSVHVGMRRIQEVVFLDWDDGRRDGEQCCFVRIQPCVADAAQADRSRKTPPSTRQIFLPNFLNFDSGGDVRGDRAQVVRPILACEVNENFEAGER